MDNGNHWSGVDFDFDFERKLYIGVNVYLIGCLLCILGVRYERLGAGVRRRRVNSWLENLRRGGSERFNYSREPRCVVSVVAPLLKFLWTSTWRRLFAEKATSAERQSDVDVEGHRRSFGDRITQATTWFQKIPSNEEEPRNRRRRNFRRSKGVTLITERRICDNPLGRTETINRDVNPVRQKDRNLRRKSQVGLCWNIGVIWVRISPEWESSGECAKSVIWSPSETRISECARLPIRRRWASEDSVRNLCARDRSCYSIRRKIHLR